MQTAYRMPVTPVQPGAIIHPSEMIPVTEMAVKSIIARPLKARRSLAVWQYRWRVSRVDWRR